MLFGFRTVDGSMEELENLLSQYLERCGASLEAKFDAKFAQFDSNFEEIHGSLETLQAEQTDLGRRLEQLDKGQGLLWETHVRSAVAEQSGRNFSEQYTVSSLQHLATRICSATGWTKGKEPDLVYRVASSLSQRLVDTGAVHELLRTLFVALHNATLSDSAAPAFSEWCSQITQHCP